MPLLHEAAGCAGLGILQSTTATCKIRVFYRRNASLSPTQYCCCTLSTGAIRHRRVVRGTRKQHVRNSDGAAPEEDAAREAAAAPARRVPRRRRLRRALLFTG